ncbi:MAG: SpoIIE family protein phosphatase [Deltaproteobacteria bacterium]|nr:SpoIIE family protein phosphatase [Deltaproteobacteria bacterium]
MDTVVTPPPVLIKWGVAARALAGQTASGDLHVGTPFPGGVLVGVVDGLGHGEEAAAAANIAVATLAAYAHESVIPLLQRCHEQLKGTRGVVLSLASFNAQESAMTWVGVGNVEGVLWRADVDARPASVSIPLRGGVVGYQLPPLRAAVLPVTRGDLVVFATDGIRSSFAQGLPLSDRLLRQAPDGPQHIADRILAQYGKNTDDALVLVVRYLGGAP